ncbi:DUF4124 domain-containing protein [Thalassotalea euphylliae]|uniref:DUF4124 domain-containing protein n=1 Tax=Thalassotalea euphylliae TaxID=1655234 RepID=A0A3E0TN86_9GAMM|nr:DUF4124 domain-containing protein [Thalassotalea euphylliae]REL26016.1 DUF4124 domain-containing protein [Thalassotalea euphylliae]
MYKFIATLCLILLTLTGNAQDTTVYRWVDNNNIVHFSHEHPTDKDYAQINVQVAYTPARPEAENSAFVDQWLAERAAEKAAASAQQQARQRAELISQNCRAAQLNLKMLGGFERILFNAPDGSSRLLSPEEKQAQLLLNQKNVEIYCDDDESSSKR